MRPAVRNPDVMLRDADRHAAEEGRRADRDAWLQDRVAAILADDELLCDALDLYGSFDAYDLFRDIAFSAARLGASEEAIRLRELLRQAAEVMARIDWMTERHD